MVRGTETVLSAEMEGQYVEKIRFGRKKENEKEKERRIGAGETRKQAKCFCILISI